MTKHKDESRKSPACCGYTHLADEPCHTAPDQAEALPSCHVCGKPMRRGYFCPECGAREGCGPLMPSDEMEDCPGCTGDEGTHSFGTKQHPKRDGTEELAREIHETCCDVGPNGEIVMDISRAAALLRGRLGEGRWIPVSERLPEHGQIVLIAVSPTSDKIVAMYQQGEKFVSQPGMWGYSATHWRPLPSPPEETKR